MRTAAILVLALVTTGAGCGHRHPPAPAAPDPPAAGEGSMRGPMHGGMMGRGGMHAPAHGRGRMGGGGGEDGTAPRADSAGAALTAPAGGAPPCPAATPALADAGRALFTRGTCAACHGARGRGTAMAPDLTDTEWLHGDGSYGFIANVVRTGVARPLRHPGAMPPMGGANLTDADVCAVAAYVHSLSREGAGGHEH